MTWNKYTLKIKIANSLHFVIAQTFLFCFHCGAISTHSPSTRVAIFPDKHILLRSITFITTILVEFFTIGYTSLWLKPETYNFTFYIHFYTNQDKPKNFRSRKQWMNKQWSLFQRIWRNCFFFLTRLIFCHNFDFIGLLSLL